MKRLILGLIFAGLLGGAAAAQTLGSPCFIAYPDGASSTLCDKLTAVDSSISTINTTLALKAALASPTFTGDPKAPTPTAGDNDTSIPTTAWVTSYFQPLDGDLTSLAAASSTGVLYYRSASSSWGPVTIGTGVAFSSGTLSATGSGGTVTSVGLTSTDLTCSGSPVTTSGSITCNLAAQAGITAASYGDASHSLAATVNSKGVLTALSSNAIALNWSAITAGKPTTLAGYGITDAEALSTRLTNLDAATYGIGTMVPALTAANAWVLKTVGAATGNLLDKASGDSLYLGIGAAAADSSKLGGVAAASYATTTAVTSAIATQATADASTYQSKTATQTANNVFAGPVSGSASAPSFRPMVAADLPAGTALLASPTFTGDPKVPTASPGDNDTSAASTAFVTAALTPYAPLASPALTGTPTVPTATAGSNTTQAASTAFVQAAAAPLAPLASPALTGTPTAPTATLGTNTTQLATTQFLQSTLSGYLTTGGTAADSSKLGGTAAASYLLAATAAASYQPVGSYLTAGNNLSDLGNVSSARGNLLLTGRVASGDTDLTLAPTTTAGARVYQINANFTAARTWTLPAANGLTQGDSLWLQMGNGSSVSNALGSFGLTLQAAGTDKINGGSAGGTFLVRQSNAMVVCTSNGSNGWVVSVVRPSDTGFGTGGANGTNNFSPTSPISTYLFTTAISANRAFNIIAGYPAGWVVRVIRSAAATGGFNLNVQDSVTGANLKALLVSQWVDFISDGTSWNEAAFGSL